MWPTMDHSTRHGTLQPCNCYYLEVTANVWLPLFAPQSADFFKFGGASARKQGDPQHEFLKYMADFHAHNRRQASPRKSDETAGGLRFPLGVEMAERFTRCGTESLASSRLDRYHYL